MSSALIAMGFAAVEAQLAHLALRRDHQAGRQRHGGWAVILGCIGLVLFVKEAVFG